MTITVWTTQLETFMRFSNSARLTVGLAAAAVVGLGLTVLTPLGSGTVINILPKPENVARVIAADMKTNSDWRIEDRVATNGRWSVGGYGKVCAGDFTFTVRSEAIAARIDKDGLTAVTEDYVAMNALIFDRCNDVELTDQSYDLIDRAYDRLAEQERRRLVREFETKTGVR